jgi:hypothetical protein
LTNGGDLRPIDKIVKESLSKFKGRVILLNKIEIATWKGSLIIAFVAGFTFATLLIISNRMAPKITAEPTNITNVAQITYQDTGGQTYTGSSNTVTVSVLPTAEWSVVAKSDDPSIVPGESVWLWVDIKNTGDSAWDTDWRVRNPVLLGTSHPFNRESVFATPYNAWLSRTRLALPKSSVAVDETIRINFKVTAPANLPFGTYRENFQLVKEWINWFPDLNLFFDIKVGNQDAYHAQLVNQSTQQIKVAPGTLAQAWVEVKNTGTANWVPWFMSRNAVSLGTSNPYNRSSIFSCPGSTWLSPSRVLLDQIVAPGANVRFNLTFRVPSNLSPGSYREYFKPVAEWITWLEPEVYWDITVEYPKVSLVSKSSNPTVWRGGSATLSVTLQNSGNITWEPYYITPYPVVLGTDRPQNRNSVFATSGSTWLSPSRIALPPAAPGTQVTVNIKISAPSTLSPGIYREYFRPVQEWVTWLDDLGLYWDITVK